MSAALHDLMRRELAAVVLYVDWLDQEAQAMGAGSFAELPVLAERKAEAAALIGDLGRQRDAAQLALGHGVGRSGAEAACAEAGEALTTAWQELLKHAAVAHQKNLRNGVVIHTHLDFTRQTLGFLKAGSQPLYGPNGMHQVGPGTGSNRACG